MSFRIDFFDETVEVTLRLGVDPKHADQMVRGTVVLPHGLGKTKKVCVIATGEKIKEAEQAGADFAGGEEAGALDDDVDLQFAPGQLAGVAFLEPAAGDPDPDVRKLVRWAIGEWSVEGLAPGEWREA